MTGLRIAENLVLPQDIVTDTLAVLAIRGAGKTYTFLVLVEQMIEQRLPVLVLDVMGVCWGLRSSADGKGPGLPVVIIGGRHGDVPLEAGAGKVIADFVIAERQPIVLDISEFSKGEQLRFALDLTSRLFQANRDPLHVVIDESDDLAPQRPFREEARTLRAVEILVRRGRARGIGVTLVTQRPAVLNKNVLAMCSTLIVGRIIAPQDRRAVQAWIEARATAVQASTFFESLAGLPTKEKWVWGPDRKIFQRVTVASRKTFDSSATPKIGATRLEPRALAEVDLEGLKKQIASTIERAKQEDPRELRREITDLRRQLAARADRPLARVDTKVTTVEIPIIRPRELKALQKSAAYLETVWSRFEAAGRTIRQEAERLRGLVEQRLSDLRPAPRSAEIHRPVIPSKAIPHRLSASGNSGLSRSQQRILDGLAWLESVGILQADKTQLALLADQSPTSGGYFNNLGRLRSTGLIEYPGPSVVTLTEAGRNRAEPGEIPKTNEELHSQLFRKLSGSQAEILRQVIASYPKEIAKDVLAEKAGQSPTSGGYFNNLGRLRSLGLIDYPGPGRVVANRALFLERQP